jgi:hypothetical protein
MEGSFLAQARHLSTLRRARGARTPATIYRRLTMCDLTPYQRAVELQRRRTTDLMRVRLGLAPWAWATSLERVRHASQVTQEA